MGTQHLAFWIQFQSRTVCSYLVAVQVINLVALKILSKKTNQKKTFVGRKLPLISKTFENLRNSAPPKKHTDRDTHTQD